MAKSTNPALAAAGAALVGVAYFTRNQAGTPMFRRADYFRALPPEDTRWFFVSMVGKTANGKDWLYVILDTQEQIYVGVTQKKLLRDLDAAGVRIEIVDNETWHKTYG